MRIAKAAAPTLLAAILGGGCGESSDASRGDSTPTAHEDSTPSAEDISTYRKLAARAQQGVRAHTAMMDPGTATFAGCRRIHEQYDGSVRHGLSQLVRMSGVMDRYMSHHGGADVADHVCISEGMTSEIERHYSAACASTNLGANQEEAGRHVDVMLAYGGHMSERCDQMTDRSEIGNTSWAPMMDGRAEQGGPCVGIIGDCAGV